jgi:hypothetical protein
MKEIRAEEYFSIGFELGKREYWTIFFNILIYIILAIVASITVVGLPIVPAILVGLTKFLLKSARGEKVDVGDSLSEGFKNGMWWKALLYYTIYIVAIIIGFMLLIAPGLYLATAWLLGFYLLVDKDMLPTEALGKSRELVHQLGFWKIFAVYIGLTIVVNLLSLIPVLGLAIIFLLPFIMMIYVAIYENGIGNSLAVNKEK